MQGANHEEELRQAEARQRAEAERDYGCASQQQAAVSEGSMKKTYTKPLLVKEQKLSAITSGVVSGR